MNKALDKLIHWLFPYGKKVEYTAPHTKNIRVQYDLFDGLHQSAPDSSPMIAVGTRTMSERIYLSSLLRYDK